MSRRPNVVLIAADTLRPDHMSCYGYGRRTTPQLDRLAREGAIFRDYQAAQIPTHPAFTTLLSGVDPVYHGIIAHSGSQQLRPSVPLLAQRLKEAGYVSGAVDNMMSMQAGPSWFARGFDYFRVYRYMPGTGEAERVTTWALQLLDLLLKEDAPFFLFLHYFDPHTPYVPPKEFRRLFYEGDECDPRCTSLRDAIPPGDVLTPLLLGELTTRGVTDFDYVIAQYDGEIAFMDQEIGRLLDRLDSQVLKQDTLVVFLSDHGEAFGEGGLVFDHHTIYDAVTHCALLMRWLGRIPEGVSVSGLASSMDIVPTLLDYAELPPVQPEEVAGVSLVPLLEDSLPVREWAPIGEASRQVSRGIVTPRWRLIEPITARSDGTPVPDFLGRPRDPQVLLFDRAVDPQERLNVANVYPDVVSALRRVLEDRLRRLVPYTRVLDPFREVTLTLDFDTMVQRHRARSVSSRA